MKKLNFYAICFASLCSVTAWGGEVTTFKFDGSFEDAKFNVENEIVNQGLVIDYVAHVGDMLNRTGADVGSDKKIFDAADIFLFCSAVLSRKAMEADPLNVAHCPYGIFVTGRGEDVFIGYRNLPDGTMSEVNNLLNDIASEAAQQ